jgi:hypothetical protein
MKTGESAMAKFIEAAAPTEPKSLRQLAGFNPNIPRPAKGTT